MARPVGLFGVAKTAVREAYRCDLRYPAAAFAYYSFVSFVPLLLLVFSVVGQGVVDEMAARAPPFVTPDAQRMIHRALRTASGQTGALVLAVGVLAWSAANVAVDFLIVVERVEGTPARSLLRRCVDGGVVLAGVSTAIVTIVLANVLFAGRTDPLAGVLVEFLALLVALTVVFVPLYYAPSRVLDSPSAAVPGAATAAAGWAALHTAVQFYAGNAAAYAVYGAVSGVLVILTGLYLAAVALMFGVAVNTTLATEARPQGAGGR